MAAYNAAYSLAGGRAEWRWVVLQTACSKCVVSCNYKIQWVRQPRESYAVADISFIFFNRFHTVLFVLT